ncbi:MAG: nitrous oxide reductase accessory protein NosL [Candidatus Omnitrophica bacterium]|nr:nitrous oxide reductase accessory protein NosL [Candidatus Omnitrophota bacterium]
MTIIKMGFLAVLLFGMSGCLSESREPRVLYGKDTCQVCRMIISEERFTTAIKNESRTLYKFDGIGCLIKFIKENPTAGRQVWVHDFNTQKWCEAEQAVFVKGKDVITPMADGLAAFALSDEAKAFCAKENGEIFMFDEIVSS